MTLDKRDRLDRGTRLLIGLIGLIASAAAGACAGTTTIPGEILDDRITLQQTTAPLDTWLSLVNRGSTPCELVAVVTDIPANALPVKDGRVVFEESGAPDVVAPDDAYAEIDGRPATRPNVVQPGQTVRKQLTMSRMPDRAERIVFCNGPGDYQRGRLIVLRFER
jgi:hypothetical protein